MKNFFGGVQFVPGVGYVEGGGGEAPLGDDASVMMISGLGHPGHEEEKRVVTKNILTTVTASPFELLKLESTVFGIKLPLWVWILIGVGTVGAGYVFFRKMK